MKQLFFIFACAVILSCQTKKYSTSLAIEHANVFDVNSGKVETDQTVIIENDLIKEVGSSGKITAPKGTIVIDGTGKWIIPGLIDVHTHLYDTTKSRLLQEFIYGITSIHSIGTNPGLLSLEAWSEKPDNSSPRVHLTTGLFGGDFLDKIFPGVFSISKSNSIEEIKKSLDELKSKGVNVIKIWWDDGKQYFAIENTFPPIAPDMFAAIVKEAHQRNMKVYVHAWKWEFAQQAIQLGVDRLIHPVNDAVVPDSIFQKLNQDEKIWVTTMAVYMQYGYPKEFAQRVIADNRLKAGYSSNLMDSLTRNAKLDSFWTFNLMPELYNKRDYFMDMIRQNTLHAKANGVLIAVGSDVDLLGIGTHLEMELLQETGLTPSEVLIAATLNGAKFLGQENKIGSIEKGKQADILILTADPTKDIRNARAIETIIKGGRIYKRDELIKTLK